MVPSWYHRWTILNAPGSLPELEELIIVIRSPLQRKINVTIWQDRDDPGRIAMGYLQARQKTFFRYFQRG